MSKIYNAVYGLALGDAFGFITERMRFPEIVEKYGHGKYLPMNKTLPVSDDTQMSLATINAIREYHSLYYSPYRGVDNNSKNRAALLMNHFLRWHNSGKARGVGRATKNSLNNLKRSNKSDPHAFGEESKGSGTVMRAPWIGLAKVIPDELLEAYSWEHSLITHNSASTAYSAYLTSLITRELYRGTIQCGDIRTFALETLDGIIDSSDFDVAYLNEVEEIYGFISRIDTMPQGWEWVSMDEIDICDYTGQFGRGDMVLAAAIAIADAYGEDDPIHGIQRAMITGGDSDSIGSLAGAFIGAANEDNIWEDLPSILEAEYVIQLDAVIEYLERQ